MMDWIVFANSWQENPSTLQQIIMNLPVEDHVLWMNTSPFTSFKKKRNEIKRFLKSKHQKYFVPQKQSTPRKSQFTELHSSVKFQETILDTKELKKTIITNLRKNHSQKTVLLATDQLITRYLDDIPYDKLVYFCEGTKPTPLNYCWESLNSETQLIQASDLVVITQKYLYPGGKYNEKTHYLPQGITVDHFHSVPLMPTKSKILGYFGQISSHLDFDLIQQLATLIPDWQLHFYGAFHLTDSLDHHRLPVNVKFFPELSYDDLSSRIQHWAAAWIPMKRSLVEKDFSIYQSINLKLREYLAAGLPAQSPPLRDLDQFSHLAAFTTHPDEVFYWLKHAYAEDCSALRELRRGAVSSQSWSNRARLLRSWV